MKKIIIAIIILSVALTGCKKEEKGVSLSDLKLNFYNVSTKQIAFLDGIKGDQSVTFDIFVPKASPKEINVSVNVLSGSTAEATTLYQLSKSQFTIPEGQLRTSGRIDFMYDGIKTDEAKSLILGLSSSDVKNGFNDTLEISIVKGNPLKIIFPGKYIARYWSDLGDVGDYEEAGWGHDGLTLRFDSTDLDGKTMILNNLWWGGLDIKVKFDFVNGTVHLDADQVLDNAWDDDPYYPDWTCGETNGTYNLSTKTLILNNFEVYGMVSSVSTLYSTETVGIKWDEENN